MEEGNIQVKDINSEEKEYFYKNNRELFYSFDLENKSFMPHVSYQNASNQLIIKHGWDVLEDRLMEIRNKVSSNEASPLTYYMVKNQMDVKMLAQYSGISKWRVKKHLSPNGFSKLSMKVIEKYAKALDISTQELTNSDFFNNKLNN